MAKYETGQEKTGGREKGTPNKSTSEHRALIDKLISSPEDLEKDIKGLEPKERIDAIIKLLEFTTPKQSRVEAVLDVTVDPITIIMPGAKKTNSGDKSK